MKIFKGMKVVVLSLSFLSTDIAIAKEKLKINLKEFALPSEVEGLHKRMGSIYYSPSIKGKVLIPVHMWGSVRSAGLHFIPVNTTIINGLSMAGGPSADADLEEVKLVRREGDKRKVFKYDLSGGGSDDVYSNALKPGDSIYIERSTYAQDRAYYTSLVGVFTTVLSSILLWRQVKK